MSNAAQKPIQIIISIEVLNSQHNWIQHRTNKYNFSNFVIARVQTPRNAVKEKGKMCPVIVLQNRIEFN